MERRVRFAAALVLLAAGCQPTTSAGNSPTPAATTMRLVAAKSSALTTYRAELNQKSTLDGKPTTIVGTLQVRRGTSPAVSADFSQFSLNGTTVNDAHVVLQDGVLYLNIPVLSATLAGGKPWLRISLNGLQNLTGINAAALAGSLLETGPSTLSRMLAASSDVKSDEPGHLHGTVGVKAALQRLDADDQQRVRRVYSENGTLTFDLWVDAKHRPTKVRLTDDKDLDTTVTFDYGASVAINPPPSDKVGRLLIG
jgi:hypothetical protein